MFAISSLSFITLLSGLPQAGCPCLKLEEATCNIACKSSLESWEQISLFEKFTTKNTYIQMQVLAYNVNNFFTKV
jgi:hypothetical protein